MKEKITQLIEALGKLELLDKNKDNTILYKEQEDGNKIEIDLDTNTVIFTGKDSELSEYFEWYDTILKEI